jgi:predicted DNA-binding protein (MmcQ/YjbR family)
MDVAAYCLSKPGAVEDYPFGSETSVFRVVGKMFALTPASEHPCSINLKCDPVRAMELRETFSEITPGYHMNKLHWNSLDLRGGLLDELVRELIDHSYDLVKKKK